MKHKKDTEDNHLYIRILKYANELDEFTYDELTKHVGIEAGSDDDNALIDYIRNGNILHHRSGHFYSNVKKDRNEKLRMSVEDKFRLLEYTDLKEARESSLSATKQARNALWISIIALVVSIGFSVFEICTRT